MTGPRLESFPAEVLCRVAEFLSSFKGKNLGALALTSRKCQSAADSSIFRSLHMKAANIEELKHWFAAADRILHRRDSHKHVRVFRVSLKPPHGKLETPDHLDVVEDDDVLVENSQKTQRFEDARWLLGEGKTTSEELIKALVKRLPGLRDFHYNLPCVSVYQLFEALRSEKSSCRLHLSNFQFRPDGEDYPRNKRDLYVLSSCLLYSIEANSFGYEASARPDFTHEAILDFCNHTNPALTHVSMLTGVDGPTARFAPSVVSKNRSRGTFKGLDRLRTYRNCSTPAKLRSFELGGKLPVRPEWIRKIVEESNFATLETLKVYMPYDCKALSDLASKVTFDSLSTLVLGLRYAVCPERHRPRQAGAAVELLASLRPLKNLRFVEEIDADIFDVTLSRHGSSLRRLWFPPPEKTLRERFFTQARLDKLGESCPLLEDLAISTARSRGDEREVAMYRSLGSLPMLQRLALILDCEDTSLTLRHDRESPPPADPSFDDFDMEEAEMTGMGVAGEMWPVRNGDLKDAMINAALDEPLACSIFEKIQSSKPEGARPLRQLELRPERGHYTSHSNQDIMRHLGRWWLVTQESKVDGTLDVNASRLRDPADCDIEQHGRMRLSDLAHLEPIFRRVWPQKDDSDREVAGAWYSWPLAD